MGSHVMTRGTPTALDCISWRVPTLSWRCSTPITTNSPSLEPIRFIALTSSCLELTLFSRARFTNTCAGNREAGDIEQGSVGSEELFMANQQAAELTEAGIGSLDDPPAFVAALFAAIFVAPLFVVAPIGRDQLDDAFLQTLPQRVRIIGSVGNHPLRLLLGTAFGARDVDFGECGFRQASFSRRGTLQPNSQRKILSVDH